MSIIGPTFTGKTEWVLNLIAHRHEITSDRLNKVIYFYSEHQDKFTEFAKLHSDVIFTKNLDDLPNLVEKNCLVVFDDMMLDFQIRIIF